MLFALNKIKPLRVQRTRRIMENKAGMKAATEAFALSARFAVALRIKPRRELRNSVGMGAALQNPLRAPRTLRLIKTKTAKKGALR